MLTYGSIEFDQETSSGKATNLEKAQDTGPPCPSQVIGYNLLKSGSVTSLTACS
jgi:hypothetical protein